MELENSLALELVQYVNRYPEPQIYYRAYKLSFHHECFIEDALRILLKSNFHWMLKDVFERSQLRSMVINPQLQKDVVERYTEQYKVFTQKCQTKQQEIQTFKNQQNKTSMRFSYKDLANLQLQSGNLSEASNFFGRVNENNSGSKTHDFVNDWALTLLWSQQYAVFRQLNVMKLETDEEKTDHIQFQVIQAVKCFAEEDFKSLINILRELKVDQLTNLNSFTTIEDLGYYFILSAIHTLSRVELEECLQVEFIRNLIEDNQHVNTILEQYRKYDYQGTIKSIKLILDTLKYDSHSSYVNKSIGNKIVNQVVRLYLSSFQSVSISSLQEILSCEEQQVFSFVEDLIKKNKLKILIDPVNKMVVQKFTHTQAKNHQIHKLYKQIQIKTTSDQIQLVNYQLMAAQEARKNIKNQ